MHSIGQRKKGEIVLLHYKNIIGIGILLVLAMSACSSKNQGVSDQEYMRSNNASEKALDKLDRE